MLLPASRGHRDDPDEEDEDEDEEDEDVEEAPLAAPAVAELDDPSSPPLFSFELSANVVPLAVTLQRVHKVRRIAGPYFLVPIRGRSFSF